MPEQDQHDLFSKVADLNLAQVLLADLSDTLVGRVTRLHYLTDLSAASFGSSSLMIPGGTPAFLGWEEARSSFVNGNFVATIMLCQSMMEHILASHLHGTLIGDVAEKQSLKDTVRLCEERGVIDGPTRSDLQRLADLRNPLAHFRHLSDVAHLDRKAINSGQHPMELIGAEATFAIALVIKVLSLPSFKVG